MSYWSTSNHFTMFWPVCLPILDQLFSISLENIRSSHPEVFLTKGALKRSPMPKGDFNKVEITLWHGWSPVNLLHIFRTPFPNNISGWLLLKQKPSNRNRKGKWFQNKFRTYSSQRQQILISARSYKSRVKIVIHKLLYNLWLKGRNNLLSCLSMLSYSRLIW